MKKGKQFDIFRSFLKMKTEYYAFCFVAALVVFMFHFNRDRLTSTIINVIKFWTIHTSKNPPSDLDYTQ
jgi:hypothetical protein